jgi:hypothetical protein
VTEPHITLADQQHLNQNNGNRDQIMQTVNASIASTTSSNRIVFQQGTPPTLHHTPSVLGKKLSEYKINDDDTWVKYKDTEFINDEDTWIKSRDTEAGSEDDTTPLDDQAESEYDTYGQRSEYSPGEYSYSPIYPF